MVHYRSWRDSNFQKSNDVQVNDCNYIIILPRENQSSGSLLAELYLGFECIFHFFANVLIWASGDNLGLKHPLHSQIPVCKSVAFAHLGSRRSQQSRQGAVKHLKSESHLPKRNCFICFNENLLKLTKNVFYFLFHPESSFCSQIFTQLGNCFVM